MGASTTAPSQQLALAHHSCARGPPSPEQKRPRSRQSGKPHALRQGVPPGLLQPRLGGAGERSPRSPPALAASRRQVELCENSRHREPLFRGVLAPLPPKSSVGPAPPTAGKGSPALHRSGATPPPSTPCASSRRLGPRPSVPRWRAARGAPEGGAQGPLQAKPLSRARNPWRPTGRRKQYLLRAVAPANQPPPCPAQRPPRAAPRAARPRPPASVGPAPSRRRPRTFRGASNASSPPPCPPRLQGPPNVPGARGGTTAT